jgi:hypothetical protein
MWDSEALSSLEYIEVVIEKRMDDDVSPIFIVGSPRSGTSILTWCMGQHPNILPIEESNWMGKLAFDLASCYLLGSARQMRSHLGSLGITAEKLLEEFGKTVHDLTLGGREKLERDYAEAAIRDPVAANRVFRVSRDPREPKRRWVDGTPEYSLYLGALLKLFPKAKFIHIVRDVQSVVRSLLHFPSTGGTPVVSNEQGAYEYWLRTVRACLEAERAFGSDMVTRIRYEDLVTQPKATLERCHSFVGEIFCANCLDPLRQRINSSTFTDGVKHFDPQTDPGVREDAERLSAELLRNVSVKYEPDPIVSSRIHEAFLEQAQHGTHLRNSLQAALDRAESAERELRDIRNGHLSERLRAIVCACTEYDSTVAVVSKGDETIMDLADRKVWHFPRDPQVGCYAGYHPADSTEAIAHVESVRQQGADYLLFPEPSLWWLKHFKEFAEHLDRRCRRVWARGNTAVLYKLNGGNLETNDTPLRI